jgi:hypothetical protein
LREGWSAWRGGAWAGAEIERMRRTKPLAWGLIAVMAGGVLVGLEVLGVQFRCGSRL